MTANTDALAGLRAATEHLSRDTEETQAKAIIKAALPFLLDLLPTDLEDGLSYLQARCTLSKAWFKALRGDIKELRKAPKQGPKAQMGSLEEVRRLHPAIDFKDNHMALGFRVDLKDEGEGVLLLISNGKEVRAEVFTPQDRGEGVELGGQNYILNGKGTPPILQDVWNLAGVKAFLENSTQPETLYEDIKAALKKYLDLPEAVYGLLAAWIVGTYFAQLFSAFPFLHFIGPKETGKSKTLEALRFASFSAWKGRDITAAALGDTVDGMRGTVLIDQAERLGEKEEGSTNLVGLLADSYKKAGGNRRVIEMTKAGRRALEFSTYGPKAFASTKQIDPDLKDRCVRIPMTRTKLPLPDLEGWEPEWGQLRDSCYRFSLLAFQEVERAYMAIPGDGTRATELWRPLGAVLKGLGVAEDEAGAVQKFFAGQCQESRHEPSTWELILLGILKEQAEAETEPFQMNSQEILTAMAIEGDHKPGPSWLGNVLATYNLYTEQKRKWTDGRYLRVYSFNPERVKNLCEIYLRIPPETPGSTGSTSENSVKPTAYSEPTQNLEPVTPGSTSWPVEQDEPTLTGSPEPPGLFEVFDCIEERAHEPDEPAKPGGIAEKKRTPSQDFYSQLERAAIQQEAEPEPELPHLGACPCGAPAWAWGLSGEARCWACLAAEKYREVRP